MLKQLKLRAAATAAAAATEAKEVGNLRESKSQVKNEREKGKETREVEVKAEVGKSSWIIACQHLLRALLKTPNSAPFRAPVKGARGYKDVVQQPMDFGTIAKKLGKGNRTVEYASIDEFAADMRLVFSNCFLYNKGELQSKLGEENSNICIAIFYAPYFGLDYPVLTWARELRQVFEYEFEQLVAGLQSHDAESNYYPQLSYEYTALLNRLALKPCKRLKKLKQGEEEYCYLLT